MPRWPIEPPRTRDGLHPRLALDSSTDHITAARVEPYLSDGAEQNA